MTISLGMPVYVKLDEDLVKGRVCKIYATKSCCVQLEKDKGCQRFPLSELLPAEEPAPDCPTDCASGC